MLWFFVVPPYLEIQKTYKAKWYDDKKRLKERLL